MTLTLRKSIILLLVAVLVVFGQTIFFGFVDIDDTIHVFLNPLLNPPTFSGLLGVWEAPFEGFYIPVTYSLWWVLAFFAYNPDPLPQMVHITHLNPVFFHFANLIV